MAFDGHKNFAYGGVATAPSPAASGTSLSVGAGEGARFPATPFNATVWPTGELPLSSNAEIVRVTNIAGDVLTIVRAQESTSARAILVGDQIAGTVTLKTLTDIETAIAAKADSATTLAGYGITDAITAAAAAATYSPLGHTHSFASLTSKPTTLAGFAITDAYTQDEIDDAIALVSSAIADLDAAVAALDATKADAATTLAGYGITDAAPLVHNHDDRYFTETESDARFAALVHAHELADINGLLSGGKISTGLLPALAITDTFVVASEAAMLALAAETGDIAVRSDESKTYILKGTDPTNLAHWELLQTPTDAVLSVNGQTGVVALTAADVGALTQAAGDARYLGLHATADLATALATPRNINGVAFDGTANITVTAAAGTLSGNTLATGVTLSSLTQVGTITSGVWNGTTIAIGNGGTGQTTAANAINALLPDQSAANGKFLTSDGSVASWATASASDATKLPLAGGTMTGTITSTLGTITVDTPMLVGTQTWNASGTAFRGIALTVTATAYHANSRLIDLKVGATTYFSVDVSGGTTRILELRDISNFLTLNGTDGLKFQQALGLKFTSTGLYTGTVDAGVNRSATGVVEINNGTMGTFRDLKARDVFTNNGYLARTFAAITDGAGAATGTLTNAPAAGNPTKWMKVDDNGTTRYVPAW